jgi:hypothetical protein
MFNIFQKKSWLWAVQEPSDIDEKKVIGRKLTVKDDSGIEKTITVTDIKANLRHVLGKEKYKGKAPLAEVYDGEGKAYLVSYLRVFAAINEEKIDEKTLEAMEKELMETEFHVEPPGLNRHQKRAYRKVNGLWRN